MSKDSGLLSHIQKYWQIYAVLVSLIVSYTVQSGRISTLEYRANIIEAKERDETDVLLEVQKDIASIKTSVEFIKERIK